MNREEKKDMTLAHGLKEVNIYIILLLYREKRNEVLYKSKEMYLLLTTNIDGHRDLVY